MTTETEILSLQDLVNIYCVEVGIDWSTLGEAERMELVFLIGKDYGEATASKARANPEEMPFKFGDPVLARVDEEHGGMAVYVAEGTNQNHLLLHVPPSAGLVFASEVRHLSERERELLMQQLIEKQVAIAMDALAPNDKSKAH